MVQHERDRRTNRVIDGDLTINNPIHIVRLTYLKILFYRRKMKRDWRIWSS
jgi:hypothetical protein